jgi:prophage regulatory protein
LEFQSVRCDLQRFLLEKQMTLNTATEAPLFLKLEEISNKTKLGKSTILAWESQGRFPAAVRLSPAFRVWLESDVHNWMMSKREEGAHIAA